MAAGKNSVCLIERMDYDTLIFVTNLLKNKERKQMEEKKILDTCNGLQHIGIPSEDLEKTCAFYVGLGFEKIYETVIHGHQHVAFLRFGDLTLECYEGACAGRAGAIDHIAINCTDVEAAYALAKEKGYTIVSDGIEELPFWENGVQFFIIEGPNAVRVELNQYL